LRQTFIRERDIADFESLNLNYKKSTIPELDRETLKKLEENIPRQTTSFTDFLGNIYHTKDPDDSAGLKIDPVRMVMLKEKEFDELRQFDTLFENLFASSGEKEYWKIKSGIFGEKFDSIDGNNESEKERDTVNPYKRKLSNYAGSVKYKLKYSTLDDKDQWEFLHETARYDYSLAGGTNFNGEEVYILDFTPGRNGLYTGRMYISTTTYALIRADYEYAQGKTGRDIQLLGIGYTENQFSGSIYFEKINDTYLLKYFSVKSGARVSVERNVELSKKKKRFLFDKELMQLDLGLDITANTENLTEYFVLEDKKIDTNQFIEFKQPENVNIIFVDQFDDALWSGYPIIEPTKQMKEYKKH
jgi:hypothetical protein